MKYGELQNNVYRKLVHDRNIMKKWDAWGMSLNDFNELPEKTEIRLYDRESKNLYITTKEKAEQEKIVGAFGEFEPQIFIPLSAFTITKHG